MLYIVLVTVGADSGAREIGRKLVEEKLAACANVISGVDSTYRWKGKIEESSETLLILKTNQDNLEELTNRVKELHSYEVPEVLALPVEKSSEEYLNWLEDNVR